MRKLATLGLVAVLAACGSSEPAPAPAAPSTPSTPTPTPTPTPAPGAEAAEPAPEAPSGPRIVVGPSRGCALRADGTVACWSQDEAPTPVPNVPPLSSLSADLLAACGLDTGGAVHCFDLLLGGPRPAPTGAGHRGLAVVHGTPCALRDGAVTCVDRAGTASTVEALAGVVEIAAARSGLCGRRSDGTVHCGLLGGAFTPIADLAGATRLAGDGDLGCALLGGGDVRCFGGEPSAFVEGEAPASFALPGITGATALVVGGNTACARTAAGTWMCMGSDLGGQLGLGSTGVRRAPVEATAFGTDEALALGENVACTIRGSQVRCLGEGHAGGLGPAGARVELAPHQVLRPAADGERATELWALGDATCARIGDHLRCWGPAEYEDDTMGLVERARHRRIGPTPLGLHGRLNEIARAFDVGVTRCSLSTAGELRCHEMPELRATGVRLVDGGEAGTCLLRTSGAVECPRDAAMGSPLFDGAAEGGEPTSGVVSLAVGADFACAADDAGQVRCAGTPESGLGWFAPADVDDDTDEGWTEPGPSDLTDAPSWDEMGPRAVELAAGYGVLCGRTAEGAAWCSGTELMLEEPGATRRIVDAGAVAIAAGDDFGCALVQPAGAPDEVRCLGWASTILASESDDGDDYRVATIDGLLDGLGPAPPPSPAPSPPAEGPGATAPPEGPPSGAAAAPTAPHWGLVQLVTGHTHACVLRSDGAVYCWGDDSLGQVGRTPSALHLTPVEMPL